MARFNAGVRTGDWEPMLAGFADDAELVFEGLPAGPFAGRARSRPPTRRSRPTTRSTSSRAAGSDGSIVAVYGWRRERPKPAGRMILTPRDGLIGHLIVTFDP